MIDAIGVQPLFWTGGTLLAGDAGALGFSISLSGYNFRKWNFAEREVA